MKKFIALGVGVVMSVGTLAYAAPSTAQTHGKAKQTMAQKVKPAPGIQNAKKSMKARLDRDRKIAETRKLAQAKKHQAQGGN